MSRFLEAYEGARRTWRDADRSAEAKGVYTAMSLTGQGHEPLEVAYATSDEPRTGSVRDVWRQRHGRAAAPLLVVVGYPSNRPTRALLCGPAGEDPPVVDVDHDHAERLSLAALSEPNRHLAIRFLSGALDGDPETLPGLRNKGLLATHALETWVPQELDWDAAGERARPLLAKRDHELVRGLGYEIEDKGNHKVLRSAAGTARAVAVFLEATEQPDQPSPRFGNQTPVTAALTSADRERLRWVVAVRGGSVRLYSTETSGAAGQRGRAETFVELNLPILPTEQAGYLDLLFSADALADDGPLQRIREASADYTSELSKRLRERVYDHVVPRLAVAVAEQVGGTDEQSLQQHYRTALTILFRLLFVAYAEDSRLLPLHINGDYTDHALKTRARRIADKINAGQDLGFDNPLTDEVEPTTDPGLTDLWSDCLDLFHAVDKGAPGWGVPAYNGGLFSPDPAVNPVGAIIDDLTLTNGDFGPALTALVVDRSPDGDIGPIDFRSLSVREFGTIYEGLLESQLSLAEQDLTLDKNDAFVPAGSKDEVVVQVGDVYLHNASGARKSSGAYFTKPFAVGHLLDHALEPTVDEHLERVLAALDDGRDSDAADLLFDFRVADVAMGSGHFLTAVVDRLEARFSTFLAEHPIPGVTKELAHLRAAAQSALGDLAETVEVETTSLLRRLIARRCVYGVDVNPISVELARVSMWIHTFVPGLPLSFLNHNLAVGNSLAGVGTLTEVEDALYSTTGGKGTGGFGSLAIGDVLRSAEEPLRRLGTITDATVPDVENARRAAAEAEEAVRPADELFDLVAAARTGDVALPDPFVDQVDLLDLPDRLRRRVSTALADLDPLHFPSRFPEVFLRDRPGFDVLVGNPPWDKVKPREDQFWARHFPGYHSLTQKEKDKAPHTYRRQRPDLADAFAEEAATTERLRDLLKKGPYPLGSGDTELSRAFAWRFWDLLREGGRIGMVLPRASTLSAPGFEAWRADIFDKGRFEEVCLLENRRHWVFDDVEVRYTIGLVTVSKGLGQATSARLSGPHRSLSEFASAENSDQHVKVEPAEFRAWNTSAAFPMVGTGDELEVYRVLMPHKKVGDDDRQDFRFRPIYDLHSSQDKEYFEHGVDADDGYWPVYKGESINLWTPDTGIYHAWIDPGVARRVLFEKRLAKSRTSRSLFSELPDEYLQNRQTLECLSPRIAWRKIARATDSRTLLTTLLPPNVVTHDGCPHLVRLRATAADEAYLLGVLATRVADWCVRRIIESNATYEVFNSIPVPQAPTNHEGRTRIVQHVVNLAAVDDRYDAWVGEVGVDREPLDDEARLDTLIDLEATVARLYGLDAAALGILYATFHATWDDGAFVEAVTERMGDLDFDPVRADA